MKRVLITGVDGSLGRVLAGYARNYLDEPFEVARLTMAEMWTRGSHLLDGIDPCDYIINNHGINHLAPIGDIGEVDHVSIMTQNVIKPLEIVNWAVAKGWPAARVLNIGSITHRVPQRMTALYCASKAALVQLTRVMARELAPDGWVVNCLCPGKIEDTEMSLLTDEQVMKLRPAGPPMFYNGGRPGKDSWEQYALSQIPMGRFTNCKEVAEAAFKILDMPAYLNGAIIDFTGGM